jgi:hypothetical protein
VAGPDIGADNGGLAAKLTALKACLEKARLKITFDF